MTFVEVAVAVGIIAAIVLAERSRQQKAIEREQGGPIASEDVERYEWLDERWGIASDCHERGNLDRFGEWYYHEPTDRQWEALGGKNKKLKHYSRGQISDLIGLGRRPSESDLEVLRFFKIKGAAKFSETRARHEIDLIFQDENNILAWKERPASPIQKEFYKYVGAPVPKGLTRNEALAFYGETAGSWPDDDPRVEYWDMFESVWEEAQDKEAREDCCIDRKPAIGKLRAAFDMAAKEAEDVGDVDLYTVADFLE